MNYELSLWFNTSKQKTAVEENATVITNEWTEEIKSGILANSDYKTPISAYDIELNEKINGEKTLSFTMPSRYYDIKEGKYLDNPFTTTIAGTTKALLYNGSLIKLRTDKGVYNFVIDDISKSSENDTYTYECSNANLLQLARSGYNLEFNTELENNMGTVFELGEQAVEGVDWHIVDENGVTLRDGSVIKSDEIKSWLTEALYPYTLTNGITATNIEDGTTVSIAAQQIVYISTTSYLNQGNTIQFLWVEDNELEVNEQLVITNSPNYSASLPSEWSSTWPTLYATASYRGKILQTTNKTQYVTAIDKICTAFTKSNVDYYGYSEYEYLTSESIQNLISENTEIVDIDDWTHTIIDSHIITKTEGSTTYTEAEKYAQVTYYEYSGTTGTLYEPECTTINSCKAIFEKSSGFSSSIPYIFCYKPIDNTQPIPATVTVQARSNNTELGGYVTYYTSSTATAGTGDLAGYTVFQLETATNLSYADLVECNVKLVLTFTNPGGTTSQSLKFTDVKFFQKATDSSGNIIVPDLSKVTTSVIKIKWYFFPVSMLTDDIISINQLTYSDICYEGDNIYKSYTAKINDDYELITSIEVKESNRFNIIQSLCEKFECWANMYVDTDDYGRTLYKYQAISSTATFVPGKQYYVTDGAPTGGYFEDKLYKYANLSNLFESSNNYYYDKADRYYTRVNNMWVRAKLGHQWGELYTISPTQQATRVYYTLTYTTDEGVTTKDWVAASTYSAGQTYYILDGEDYVQVTVGNQFVTTPSKYCTLKDTWYSGLYEKYYSKYITFNEYTGKLNLAGFKYGINLKNITRELDTSNLVTKLIVADNTNEYATNGYCSIVDASQNAMGANALYNFSYYLSAGLIDKDKFQRDMYGSGSSRDLAYAMKYQQINKQSVDNIDEISELSTALIKLESQYTVYSSYTTQAHQDWIGYVDDIKEALSNAGITKSWNDCADSSIVYYDATNYSALINDYIKKRDYAKTNEEKYSETVNRLSGEVDTYNAKLAQLTDEQSGYTKLKEALDYEFNQRYQNYVREGTWSSDDYYDADKYYFDANDVLLQSAFPTVSYSFSVEDLSDYEGWKDYNFSIGDKTYVRDAEFFKDQDDAQMEVIISEIKWIMDQPWETQITVQNYSTEFQDLFSKIEAATQVLQYNEAKYDKAGTIATDQEEGSYMLSNILSKNTNIITTASGTFTYDTNGITAIDSNTKYQLKLTSRGLVLSKDGGATWTTGVSGSGINAEVINAGKLNVDNISIYGGASNKQFEWDKYGINAYSGISGSHLTKYVRFCKYGLYGTTGMAYNSIFTSAADIMNSSDVNFALTWNGFIMRSTDSNAQYCKIETNSEDSDKVTLPHYEVYTGIVGEEATENVYEYNETTGTYFITSDSERSLEKIYYHFVTDTEQILKYVISAGKTNTYTTSTGVLLTQVTPNFVVYNDGTIRANNGLFDGVIQCQDIRNKKGVSMLTSNDIISNAYLDLGGITITGGDEPNITIRPYANAGDNKPHIYIDSSTLQMRGSLIHMYSQDTSSTETHNYARICFHNQYNAATNIQYGYVGAGVAVMGTGITPETGIILSCTGTDDYSGDTTPYLCVSPNFAVLKNGAAHLVVKSSGVYFNHGSSEQDLLIGSGGSGGTTTAIAVFG